MKRRVVILADGLFPGNDIPLGYLNSANTIVCCDGAVSNLIKYGLEPYAIVGDMDSIPEKLKQKYKAILHPDHDHDSNDLTKAVKYCIAEGFNDISILAATGLREDHALGNISLLADYSEFLSVKMISDYGIFIPINSGNKIRSWPGQQVSVFSMDENTKISSENLRYPLNESVFPRLWMGTLNECSSDWFTLTFGEGRVIVFLVF